MKFHQKLYCYTLLFFMHTYVSTMIQKTDQSYITRILHNNVSNKSITSIQELKGGLGGARLYTVTFDHGDPYVVRLLVGTYAKEKNWQDKEIEVMKNAHSAGVGPKIFASHSKDSVCEIGYIVMQKINFIPPEQIPWNHSNTYETLGNFLQKMHNQPCVISTDQNLKYEQLTNTIKQLKTQLEEAHINSLQEQLDKVGTFVEKVQQALVPQKRTHLVHGDLLLGNLLYDGNRFWAIDWEHSRTVADPLFDVALVHDCLVPNEYHQHFMQGYYGKKALALHDQEQFNLIQALADCFMGLAYTGIVPPLFAQQFHQYTKAKIDTSNALHNLIHTGLKRKDLVTFGTLLFMQGYRWLEPESWPIMEKTLNRHLQLKQTTL